MKMNNEVFNGALARIILRYVFGGLAGGSWVLGKELASDPDLVWVASLGIAGAAAAGSYVVERFYAIAKKRGWTL